MARDFDGSTGFLTKSSALATTYPVTMSCWFNSDNDTTNLVLMSLSTDAGTARFALVAAGAGTGGNTLICSSITSAGGGSNAETGAPYWSSGAWHHAAGVIASPTSRYAYLDGAASAHSTTSRVVTGLDRTMIASRFNAGTTGAYFSGKIAEVGVWNIDLSPAELTMLARGVSPLLVRPASLVTYCPVYGRNSPEIDFMDSGTFALTGTADQAAHPRIIMPAAQRRIYIPAAGGGVSITVPLGTITITNNVPVVGAGASVAVPLGTITLSDLAPTVSASSGGASVSVPVALITITGNVPVVGAGASVTVPLNQITVTGNAPTVTASADTLIAVPLNQLAITGHLPTVTAAELLTLYADTAYEVYIRQQNGVWNHTQIVFTGDNFGVPS